MIKIIIQYPSAIQNCTRQGNLNQLDIPSPMDEAKESKSIGGVVDNRFHSKTVGGKAWKQGKKRKKNLGKTLPESKNFNEHT